LFHRANLLSRSVHGNGATHLEDDMNTMIYGAMCMVFVVCIYATCDIVKDRPFLHWAGNPIRVFSGGLVVLIMAALHVSGVL